MGGQVGVGVDKGDPLEDCGLGVLHEGLDQLGGLVRGLGMKLEMELTEREEALDIIVDVGVLEALVDLSEDLVADLSLGGVPDVPHAGRGKLAGAISGTERRPGAG
jgi:hypothetical protein